MEKEESFNDSSPPPSKMGVLEKFKFPGVVYLILVHELLERFSFYGMKGILSIYLNQYLGFDEDVTTVIYHLFTAVSYLLPIIGAIIADNYWGRFKTVVVFGLVYLVGHILMPLTALKLNQAGPMIGIFILAIGTGTIKPCVAAFGADQIPDGNPEKVDAYFSLFYAAINIGAFISQLLTPILRKDIQCIDGYCYPLAFGVPAITFFITYILFLVPKFKIPNFKYIIKPNEGNVLTEFARCIKHAIGRWGRERKNLKKHELLDYADDEFDLNFIHDSKMALSVIVLFIPFPLFWALFDQQGSRWTLQADKMDGYISPSWTYKPDQMQSINPLLVVILIPIFNSIIYPVLGKCNILTSATSRIVTGYLFAAAAFVYTGFIQIAIDNAMNSVIPINEAPLKLVNMANFSVNFSSPLLTDPIKVQPNNFKEFILQKEGVFNFTAISLQTKQEQITMPLTIKLGNGISIISILDNNDALSLESGLVKPNIKGGITQTRIVLGNPFIQNISIIAQLDDNSINLFDYMAGGSQISQYSPLERGIYDIQMKDMNGSLTSMGKYTVKESAFATLGLSSQLNSNDSEVFNIIEVMEVKGSLISMFYQLPQYLLMVMAEILFSVTAMAFAYSEAPPSMKALLQSAYLITIFVGNIIVTIVALLPGIPNPAWEFFLFAILVSIGGVINGILAWRFNKAKAGREQDNKVNSYDNTSYAGDKEELEMASF